MSIDLLQTHYPGFWIDQPLGNNAFSYEARQHKNIFVPPIIQGSWDDLQLGERVVFREVVEGEEQALTGLNYYLYVYERDKHIFVVDNHNEVFPFWILAYQSGWMPAGSRLVHVDQHRDTREPTSPCSQPLDQLSLKQAVDYTHHGLNVGNFIPPALDIGLFGGVDMVLGQDDFNRDISIEYCLDIDIDIFAPELDYIPVDFKIQRIRAMIDQASVITVATSPFFIGQALAKKVVKLLFAP